MKYSECNARQKRAFLNIKNASNWLLGGLENTMLDNTPDSAEYKAADARLKDHDGLVQELYEMSISEVYTDGSCQFGDSASKVLKDIRFCGKEWLMARCEARIRKEGY